MFKIRLYGRTELALAYSPDLTPQAAFRRLTRWIEIKPGLTEALVATGLQAHTRVYTPAQVRLIVEALGEP